MSDDAGYAVLSTRASHLSPLDASSLTYDVYLWERVAHRRFSRQVFSDDGELESLIRVVVPRMQLNGDRFERGYSDCVRYDGDSLMLGGGVLP